MGVEPQETRGIPRNRKCGNCRFYEPAPLWRKGWCRNTKLYPSHANHLVDANTIDCEGGFRSRIYWEPLAAGQVAPPVPTDARPVAPTNVTPISPVAASVEPLSSVAASASSPNPPVNPIIQRPVSQPITPSPDAYLRPMDDSALNTYKHPLADRSFAKSGDDSIRPINTNPAPIISRQSPPNPSLGQDNTPGSGGRTPFTPPTAGEPSENSYRPFGVRSNRSFSSGDGPTRNFSTQEPVSRNYASQEPNSRNITNQEGNGRNYSSPQEPVNNRDYPTQEPGNRNFSAGDQPTRNFASGDQPTRNFSTQERGNRNFSQEPSGRNFPTEDAPTRSFSTRERNQPFITPPPQDEDLNQPYGSDEGYGETESYNEPASGFQDQATRPFEAQATRPYQAPQFVQPPAEPEEWADEEPAAPPPPPTSRRYNDASNFSNRGNYSPPQNNEYPTQQGNYSSQFNTEKEPIRIQEALPANNRPRPLEPKKQPQPVPARFRPVKEDQPAANMPVTRDWRAILREKAPFTRNWNLEGITMNRQTILPWAIGGVLVLILVVVLVVNLGKKPDDQNNPTGTVAASSATTGAASGTTSGNATTAAGATTVARTTAAGGTATTAAGSTTTTTAATAVKTATVKGTGSVLNVRDTPTTKGKVVTTVKDGEKVTVKDGPKDGDGISWYQVEYNGATGWASAAYLEL